MVQRVSTVAFEGIEARAVDVQVQVAPGLPAFANAGCQCQFKRVLPSADPRFQLARQTRLQQVICQMGPSAPQLSPLEAQNVCRLRRLGSDYRAGLFVFESSHFWPLKFPQGARWA
jgi:hypothetical protein